MKVSIARIRLYLKTGKTLADGSHPIMLMVSYNGKKEVSTHYSCSEKHWDKRGECVKRGFPNYLVINFEINKLKQKAIEKRDEYERSGTPYTPQMILSTDVEKQALTGDLSTLISQYISDMGLRLKTRNNYRSFIRLAEEFAGKGLIITQFDISFTKRFATWMSNTKGLKDGSIRAVMGRVAALTHYAIELGLMREEDYPFRSWKYTHEFSNSSNMAYIHWKTLEVMKEMLLNELIDVNENRWSYKNGAIEAMTNRISGTFARCLYILFVLFQGLAPIDLLNIRKSELQLKRIGDKDYYYWDGKRRKTGMPVKVLIPAHNRLSEVLIKTFLMFNDSEWFLPVLNGLTPNDSADKRMMRIHNTIRTLAVKLREWFKEVNAEVIRRNVEEKAGLQMIDVKKCSYYSARHSYAQMYMSKGGSPLALATLLGRAINGISAYVKVLESEGDLAEAVSIL